MTVVQECTRIAEERESSEAGESSGETETESNYEG